MYLLLKLEIVQSRRDTCGLHLPLKLPSSIGLGHLNPDCRYVCSFKRSRTRVYNLLHNGN
jgi:hypothetical protein